MTVYPQEYTLHCVKTGYQYYYDYHISINANMTVTRQVQCYSGCSGSQLLNWNSHTYDHIVNISWDGETMTSGSVNHSVSGDQHYQCELEVSNQPIRRHSVAIQGK